MALLKGNLANVTTDNLIIISIKYAFRRLLLNGINRKKKNQCIVFINSQSQLKISLSSIKELMTKEVGLLVLTTKYPLYKELKTHSIPTKYCMGLWPSTDKYKGIELEDSESSMYQLVVKNISKFLHLKWYFKRYIQFSSPKYALVGNDITFEGAIFRDSCKESGIRIGCIQHGSMDYTNPMHSLISVDDLYVWGDVTKESLLKLKIQEKNIQVVGRPSLEYQSTGQIQKSDLKMPFVLIGTSGIGILTSREHHLLIIQVISEIASEFNSINWLFKLHTKDSKEYYKNLPKNVQVLNNTDMKEKGYSNEDLMLHCIFTISGGSTFSLDALSFGKKVITLDLMGEYENVPFVLESITEYVTSKETFKQKVSELSKDDFSNSENEGLNRFIFGLGNPNYRAESVIAENIVKWC